MKIAIFFFAFFVGIGSAAGGDTCSKEKDLNDLKRRLKNYQPQPPAQGTSSGQRGGQQQHSQNMGPAVGAANACVGKLNEFEKNFSELAEEMDSEQGCNEQAKDARRSAREAKAKAAQCAAAGGAAAQQGNESKGNEKKMGDEKKGEGGSPQMPPPPPPPEKKKDDEAKKERERKARVTACKERANRNQTTEVKNCEAEHFVVPGAVVKDVEMEQQKCKQDAIFRGQEATINCENTP